MRKLWIFLFLAGLVASCGNRRPSEGELMQKIDSIRSLENKRHLLMQGIKLGESSPLQAFYDSLSMEALPVRYSDDYVKFLIGYSVVPIAIVNYLELEGRVAPKAIALPEALGIRLMLLAADLSDGEYEIWLYSLDDEYYPVDKLLLYEPKEVSKDRLGTESQRTLFSITSDYEIRVMEFADNYDTEGQLSIFVVDNSRMFVEKISLF